MKVECLAEKIKSAVSQAERVTGKNLTLPVLGSVLIIAGGKQIKLRSMNLSLGLEIIIPAKVEKDGILAIKGSVLVGIFSNIPDSEKVVLEGVDGNLIIKTNKSRIKVKGETYEDFPSIPKVEGVSFDVEINKIIEGVKSVYYSASVSDIKAEISSVYIYKDGDDMYFVSTDSFRLAEKKIKVKKGVDLDGVIIPFKNINEIIRILGEGKDVAKVCFNKNQISFEFNDVYLTSRVIDGVFPDYRQILPKEFTTEVVLLKQDLLNALKLSNIFSDKFNQLNLVINKETKLFELSSSNTDIGENKTQIDAAITGEGLNLSFNYKYFLDCIPSIIGDSVLIRFNGATKPIVVSSVSDKSFTYLIMPMNS